MREDLRIVDLAYTLMNDLLNTNVVYLNKIIEEHIIFSLYNVLYIKGNHNKWSKVLSNEMITIKEFKIARK